MQTTAVDKKNKFNHAFSSSVKSDTLYTILIMQCNQKVYGI